MYLIFLAFAMNAHAHTGLQRAPERELILRPLTRTTALLDAIRSLRLNYAFALDDNQMVEADLEADAIVKNFEHLKALVAYDEIQEEVRQMMREHFARVERTGRAKSTDLKILASLLDYLSFKGTVKFSDIRKETELYRNLDVRNYQESTWRKMMLAQLKSMRRHRDFGTLKDAVEALSPTEKIQLENNALRMAAEFEYDPNRKTQACAVLLFKKRRSSRR